MLSVNRSTSIKDCLSDMDEWSCLSAVDKMEAMTSSFSMLDAATAQ